MISLFSEDPLPQNSGSMVRKMKRATSLEDTDLSDFELVNTERVIELRKVSTSFVVAQNMKISVVLSKIVLGR